jgi:hypothetical protein
MWKELWRGHIRNLVQMGVISLPPPPNDERPIEGQLTIDQMVCNHVWAVGSDACDSCGVSYQALHFVPDEVDPMRGVPFEDEP